MEGGVMMLKRTGIVVLAMVLFVCAGIVSAAPLATLTVRYNGTLEKVDLFVNAVKRGDRPGRQCPSSCRQTFRIPSP